MAERRRALVLFVAVVLLLAALCVASVAILSATRAYVGGESLYSKAQKNAVWNLSRFLELGAPSYHDAYRRALAVPLGDRQARLALEQPDPDLAAARAGLLQGGNDPQDIDGMIALFRLFRHVGFMADAIDIWEAADGEIAELQALGERARRIVDPAGGGTDADRQVLRVELENANARLDVLEQAFSARLGRASRAVRHTLLALTILLSLTLIGTGVAFAVRTGRRITASQHEVNASNARWELAAAAGDIGVFDWNLSDDRVLLDVRGRALLDIRIPPSGPVPLSAVESAVHEDDRPALRSVLSRAIRERGAVVHRCRITRADAPPRFVELIAQAQREQPIAANRVVGMFRDITEVVEAERMRLDKIAAERASKAKDEFLSRVSHELRTPLNAVLGFTQLMLDDRRQPPTATQKERLEYVAQGGRYLLRLVNDLLDLTSIEGGAVAVELQPVDVVEVARSALRLMQPAVEARDLRLEFDAPPPGSPALRVRADPARLEQVFVNVLSNAVKYNRVGGVVALSFARVGGEVTIEVRDEGAGMTPEQQAMLFQPFNRLGAEYSNVEGAGLGLIICRQLVERFAGRLALQSAPGQGTTVRIGLPAEDGVVAAAEAAKSMPLAGDVDADPCGRVLYIEDDPVNAELMRAYLSIWPRVQLEVAAEGGAGIAIARRWRPDLVLLDMQLPDMSGLEVLVALRANAGPKPLRVIALSANAMPDDVALARRAGVEAYWTKPLDLGRFREDLPRLLD